jgi:hypothetical protein
MPFQQITAEADVGQERVSVIEAEWKTLKIHDASQIKMKVLPDDPLQDLSDALRCRLFINGHTIASGAIDSVSFNEDGTQTVHAYDAARKLKQFKMTRKFEQDPAQEAFNAVCEKALVVNGQDLITQAAQEAGVEGPVTRFSFDANDDSCWKLLNKISIKTDWTWYVDAFDRVWLASDIYSNQSASGREDNVVDANGGEPDSRRPMQTKQLQYVTDHSDGLEVPPYQKVVVTGDNVNLAEQLDNAAEDTTEDDTGEDGEEDSADEDGGEDSTGEDGGEDSADEETDVDTTSPINVRLSKRPTIGAAETDLYTEGDPIFADSDKSIKTNDQAVNTAKQILKNFRQKQKGGEITVAGRADIRPFDIVQMPQADANEQFFGEEYLVYKLKHTVDSSNGFTTKIFCGGLVDDGDGWVSTSKPQLSAPPQRTVNVDGEDGNEGSEEEESEEEESETNEDGNDIGGDGPDPERPYPEGEGDSPPGLQPGEDADSPDDAQF